MTDVSPDLSIAERVDAVCDQFERKFRAGQEPRLESYLSVAPESLRAPLFRTLLDLELELRQNEGQQPAVADYLTRFPDRHEQIGSAFAAASQPPSMISSVKLTGVETSQGPNTRKLAATKPSDSQPLKKLGRFEIRSVLGEGAFGTVYRARDPQLDREVAVKVPHFSSQQSREDRQRFLREARAAAGLHHAHICPVHEVGSVDGHDYIVLAYIDGKPLSKILQSKPQLNDRQVVAVIRKIAMALQEAHDNGIVHRDLKPANIMINRKGEPVIMDFGLARRCNSGDAQISQHGQIMGTPAYMSPEQARGDGKSVGPASDVYSLGIVLYELLCGRRPFEGTVTEVIGQILHAEAPPPAQFRPEVDLRLQAICLKSIAKNRTDRYASMLDLANALTDYSKTLPSREQSAAGPQTEGKLAKDLNTTQFADLLAAITSDVESKVEGAVRRAGHSSRVPWWSYLAGSGLMGVVMFLGIFFFIRKDTVTVIVNIPGIDTKDPSFTFMLDEKMIPAESFEAPVELKPGKHVLVVNKDGQEFKRFLFNVGKEDNEKVVVQDVTPKSPAPETGIERPAPQFTVPEPAIAPFNAVQAQAHQAAWAKHLDVPVEYTNSIGMKFRLIPPGSFTMGTPADEIAALLRSTKPDDRPAGDLRSVDAIASEGPQHQVELTHAVYLGVFEVTQGQYKSVTGTNPSAFQENGSDRQFVTRIKGLDTSVFPVEAVSWLDAAEFCAKLSRSEELNPYYFVAQNNEVTILNGTGYRLPTEAVWEFACRAGTTTRYWNGDDAREVRKIAWLFGNAGGRTHAVGELPANPFGLHDVYGNLWEWVEDGWDPNAYQQFADHPAVDPLTPAAPGARRVIRGGIWSYGPYDARSSKRMAGLPTLRWHQPGFRVSLPVDAVKQALSRQATGPGRVKVGKSNRTGYQPELDGDRRAAEWALRADAYTVNILAEGLATEIPRGGKLPGGPLTVTAIDLTGCKKVTDAGTEQLKGLKSIRTLILDSTQIGKLDFLDEMVNLEVLNLQSTSVTDESLAHIKGLTKLRYINLLMFFGNNKITDVTLENMKGLNQLETLIVDHCNITDAGLQHLMGHSKLRSLHLGRNNLTDAGVESLKTLSKLEELRLHGTKITETGVNALRAALPKCQITN